MSVIYILIRLSLREYLQRKDQKKREAEAACSKLGMWYLNYFSENLSPFSIKEIRPNYLKKPFFHRYSMTKTGSDAYQSENIYRKKKNKVTQNDLLPRVQFYVNIFQMSLPIQIIWITCWNLTGPTFWFHTIDLGFKYLYFENLKCLWYSRTVNQCLETTGNSKMF